MKFKPAKDSGTLLHPPPCLTALICDMPFRPKTEAFLHFTAQILSERDTKSPEQNCEEHYYFERSFRRVAF